MFNLGVPEIALVLFVALMVFGPKRLPEIARSMGKFMRNFQNETNRAINDLKAGIEPATHGIFDTPDQGSEQATAETTPFIPAEEMRTTRTRAKPKPKTPATRAKSATRRAPARKSASRPRSATAKPKPKPKPKRK